MTAHQTFTVRHVLEVRPAQVFRAFADPKAKAAWSLGPADWSPRYELDLRVGGHEIFCGGPPDGEVHTIEARYLDVVADERIVYAYDVRVNDTRAVAALATIQFMPTPPGTTIVWTEQAAFLHDGDHSLFERHLQNVVRSLARYLASA
ncbi:polyketide cyclase [Kribbella pittospori]|uniref:Polyketide cyclase n=1 Tax=Kribbella pittospori TaxID=722689 RepID=A0A4R0KBS0_9ACTN|nr:SRPBCC domain-containing protein [Kribbella pittospori]TCC57060.1 polyketide cyclase [Kribbella pittospori]